MIDIAAQIAWEEHYREVWKEIRQQCDVVHVEEAVAIAYRLAWRQGCDTGERIGSWAATEGTPLSPEKRLRPGLVTRERGAAEGREA